MKTLSKKALLSILSLVLTFVALGATTFAWFSLGTTATVNPFDVEVKGSEGLEIQFGNDTSWYTTINSELMAEYIEELVTAARLSNDNKFVMDAVTSVDGKQFFTYDFNGTSLQHISPNQLAVANKDYLSLTFKLRTSAKKAINLTTLDVTGSGGSWLPDQNFTLAKDSTLITAINPDDADESDRIATDLADALRVSFVVGTEDAIVFEKEEDTTNTSGTLAEKDGNFIGAFEYFAKRTGYYANNQITLTPQTGWDPDITLDENYFGQNITKLLFAAPTADLEVGESYYNYTVTINVWFEGYDNEAFDAVLEQFVSIALAFSLAE